MTKVEKCGHACPMDTFLVLIENIIFHGTTFSYILVGLKNDLFEIHNYTYSYFDIHMYCTDGNEDQRHDTNEGDALVSGNASVQDARCGGRRRGTLPQGASTTGHGQRGW